MAEWSALDLYTFCSVDYHIFIKKTIKTTNTLVQVFKFLKNYFPFLVVFLFANISRLIVSLFTVFFERDVFFLSKPVLLFAMIGVLYTILLKIKVNIKKHGSIKPCFLIKSKGICYLTISLFNQPNREKPLCSSPTASSSSTFISSIVWIC